jgi:CRP-like cAMP-binding protein
MKPKAGQPRNLLLQAMERTIGAKIDAERILLEQGNVICEPWDGMRSAYFPLSSVLSAVSTRGDGTTLATALRGHEAAFGLLSAIRKAKAQTRGAVQIGGPTLRVEARHLAHIFDTSNEVRYLLLSYWDAVMFEYEQGAVCNSTHPVAARLNGYLLEIHERVIGDVVPLTHEDIANLIGVNRTTVSLVMSRLRHTGIIETDRAHIRIVDPRRLFDAGCDCYSRVRKRFEALYQEPSPGSALPDREGLT